MAVFADWTTPSGRETRLLMAIEVGASEWYREGLEGSLVDSGNALFDDDLTTDIRINRVRWTGGDLTLNRAGTGAFSDQFEGTDPPLDDGIWHVVTDSDHVQVPNSLLDDAGGGFARWMPTGTADIAVLDGISQGDGIVFAFTMPATAPPPMAADADDMAVEVGDTLSVTLAESTELTGTVTYSATNLPAGATFTPATRLLEWTPTADAASMVTYTATDGTDSDVKRFLLMAHRPDMPRYALLIDWDGDLSFSHPLTDGFGDLNHAGVRTSRGRNYASMIYGRAVAGTLDGTLNNYEGQYDRFASSSDLNTLLVPRRRMVFCLAHDSNAYRLWSGLLDRVNKVERLGGDDVVKIHATDLLGDLARTDCGVAYVDNTTAGGAVELVLEAANVDEDDIGTIDGPTALANYFAADAKALQHIRNLEEAEAGFFWLDARGKLNLDNVNLRSVRTRSRNVQVTITDEESPPVDALQILPPLKQHDPMKDIANIIRVEVRQWSAAAAANLWELADSVALDPGGSVVFVIQHTSGEVGRDAVTGRYISRREIAIAEWIDPVVGTDIVANSQADGTGADLSSDLEAELEQGGTSSLLTLTNTGSQTLHVLDSARVRGRVLNESDPIAIELRDQDSVDEFGPRPYTVASDLLPTVNEAITYGQYILQLYGQPQRKAEVSVEVSDMLHHAGERELGDRADYTARGISSQMYIESIGHTLHPGFRHDMRFTLSQAGLLDDVIILDTGPGLDTGILGA